MYSKTVVRQSKYIGGNPDQTDTDNITNYFDTPKYVIDVLGGPCQRHTDRCLPESRNYRQRYA